MVTPASKLLLRLPADMPPSFNIASVAHYFPPINSSGAKRFEAMTKYFAREGHRVAVFTTCKTGADGEGAGGGAAFGRKKSPGTPGWVTSLSAGSPAGLRWGEGVNVRAAATAPWMVTGSGRSS